MMKKIRTIEEAMFEMGLRWGSSVEEMDRDVFDGKLSKALRVIGQSGADVGSHMDDIVQILLKRMFDAYVADGATEAAIHVARAAEHLGEAICLQLPGVEPEEPEEPQAVCLRFVKTSCKG